MHESNPEVALEGLNHLFAFVESHQTSVNEHAGELITDRSVHQRSGDRRVDPSAQSTDSGLVTDLLTDLGDSGVDDRVHRPRARAPAGVGQETLNHVLAVRGVNHLRVELHAVELLIVVLKSSYRSG